MATSSLQPRSGISLLEVLIAMFVLLFGLMGVAAIFPVGNHYAARSEQFDRGASLAGTAFAEVRARGMLRPDLWIYADGTTDFISEVAGPNFHYFTLNTPPATPGHAFVIDSLAAGEANAGDDLVNYFPYNANANANPWNGTGPGTLPDAKWPVRRITFPNAAGTGRLPSNLAATIFRLHDDVVGELPEENDRPGMQRFAVDSKGTKTLTDDLALARDYTGSYSWFATVMPTTNDALFGLQPSNSRYGSYLYEVSVAVVFRRETVPSLTSERLLSAELLPGGDLIMYGPDVTTVDAAFQDVASSHWIALTGVHPTTGKFLLRWYRLLSLDDETNDASDSTNPTPIILASTGAKVTGRRAMIEGPDWPTRTTPPVAPNLRAVLLPRVIGVATQTVKLDTE